MQNRQILGTAIPCYLVALGNIFKTSFVEKFPQFQKATNFKFLQEQMAEDDNQIDVTISEMGSDYEGNQSTACENDYIWQSDGDLSDEETRKWPKKSLKCKRQPKRARKEANAVGL